MAGSLFADRIAGAPITWGVDQSPGWGFSMGRDRVLDETQEVGLRATELGLDGFLPIDPVEFDPLLEGRRMQMVGGFVPVRLSWDELLPAELAYAERAAGTLAGAGAATFVLGPASVLDGYDTPIESPTKNGSFSTRLYDGSPISVTATVWRRHFTPTGRWRWTARSRSSGCWKRARWTYASTRGNVALSGGDPLEVARMAGDRVVHVHLKHADERMAEQVQAGERPFRQAVIDGLSTPLGMDSWMWPGWSVTLRRGATRVGMCWSRMSRCRVLPRWGKVRYATPGPASSTC